ncbi:uncharacterized protein L3040_009034 [Drepanopeziza brunnea f. sp. 'multigermtubi']|uniref:uncharacterized protein n=1 Tax=Drepanopeziza brunnea f. sp. 'multigermtubi' TaxID=698441 RepID=UPI0023958566|nr:hypothetical protein L3040_009034 [Drepanopeziza brunnea f. sp. 'multigermtubi']
MIDPHSDRYGDDGGNDTYGEWLRICWRQQGCGGCLERVDAPCSWCPASGTCIPNPSRLQLLAPFSRPNICPLWEERWELRSGTFGCHISTLTAVTGALPSAYCTWDQDPL